MVADFFMSKNEPEYHYDLEEAFKYVYREKVMLKEAFA